MDPSFYQTSIHSFTNLSNYKSLVPRVPDNSFQDADEEDKKDNLVKKRDRTPKQQATLHVGRIVVPCGQPPNYKMLYDVTVYVFSLKRGYPEFWCLISSSFSTRILVWRHFRSPDFGTDMATSGCGGSTLQMVVCTSWLATWRPGTQGGLFNVCCRRMWDWKGHKPTGFLGIFLTKKSDLWLYQGLSNWVLLGLAHDEV